MRSLRGDEIGRGHISWYCIATERWDSEEIDENESDPFTGNIIGAALDVQRLLEIIRRIKI